MITLCIALLSILVFVDFPGIHIDFISCMEEVKVPEGKPIRLLEWLVKVDDWIKYGKPVIVYRHIEDPSTGVKTKELHLKSRHVGRVKNLCVEIGQVAMPGYKF